MTTTWKVTEWTNRPDPFDIEGVSGVSPFGFSVVWISACKKTSDVASRVLAIPYWFVVASMILLSSRLLQSNPPPLKWDQIKLWLILFAAFVLIVVVLSAPPVQS